MLLVKNTNSGENIAPFAPFVYFAPLQVFFTCKHNIWWMPLVKHTNSGKNAVAEFSSPATDSTT